MELPMFLDVSDLPAYLQRWDSSGPCEEGLLTVPSYDDFNNMKGQHCIFSLENEDERSSGLSLGSSPSNASSTMNADGELGLDFNFEFFDEGSDYTHASMNGTPASPSIISLPTFPAPPLPAPCAATAPIGLPIGKLNLKLDASAVASTWNSMAGNAPVFRMPRSILIAAAANIPSIEARAASLSVEAQEDWAVDGSRSRPSSRNNTKTIALPGMNTKTAAPNNTNISNKFVLSSKPHQGPRPPRKTTAQKRKSGGKSSDKRPRIKGRFVRREELETFVAATNDKKNKEEDILVVPDSITLGANINCTSNIETASLSTFEMIGMELEAQCAY